MGWLLQLSDRPLADVTFLEGDPLLVAAWYTPADCEFFAVADGALVGRLTLDPPVGDRKSSSWRDFLETLRAPNGAYLPRVTTPRETVFTTYDGQLYLYHQAQPPFLRLDDNGQSVVLVEDSQAVAVVGFDRELGAAAALFVDNHLSFFQQYVAVAHCENGTSGSPVDSFLRVADAGALVLLGSRMGLRVLDFAGQELAANDHESGMGTCSPSGHLIAAASGSGGTLRVYDDRLTLLAEDSVADLLSRQHPIQLMHEIPGPDALLQAIDLTYDGILALGAGGYLSVLTVDDLTPVPTEQPLL